MKFWLLVVFLAVATAIPFPWKDATTKTITLLKDQTYEINRPIVWSGIPYVNITGSGATIIVNGTLKNESVFQLNNVKGLIWDSVVIRGSTHPSMIRMNITSGERGFFQLRGCSFTSSTKNEIVINGNISSIILENNKFVTNSPGTHFLAVSDLHSTTTRMTVRDNEWLGNYKIGDPGRLVVSATNNLFPETGTHARWLAAGPFRHPGSRELCYKPSMHDDMNSTYLACSNSWFLEAIELQSKGNWAPISFSPIELKGDAELPRTWLFRGNQDIDFGGYSWEPKFIEVAPNTTVTLRGLEQGWSEYRLQILILRGSTLEMNELVLRGEDKIIDVAVTSETSHLFIMRSNVDGASIVGSGIGHVHVQDSSFSDFVLTAGTLWASGNVFKDGKVVTQPYLGHTQYSDIRGTEYHVSPFYLGQEPNYRHRLVHNIWRENSDIVLAKEMSREIAIEEDIVESSRLARKLAYSPYIKAKNLIAGDSAPMILSPPVGAIWPEDAQKPIQCPDGTAPGLPDRTGAHTMCIPCPNPKMSKGGSCNNIRELDVLFQPAANELRVGADGDPVFVADTSYLNWQKRSQIKKDCYTCAALCLGVPVDQLDNYTFTLPQLLEPNRSVDHTTQCSKCALYCADLSGCESLCVPLLWQILIIFAGFLVVVVPLAIAGFILLKPSSVFVESSDSSQKFNCPACGFGVESGSTFCPTCGAKVNSFDLNPQVSQPIEHHARRRHVSGLNE